MGGKARITPAAFIRKNSLLIGILSCIILAGLYPKFGSNDGPLRPDFSAKYGAVFVIFLVSGLSLKTDNILHTFQNYRLHLYVQLFTFVFIPIFTHVFIKILHIFHVNLWILKGLITVACMPPPVSSAVILTKTANGNETAAIFNSILGSFLGVILTPISLLFNLGSTTIIPLFGAVSQLLVTVVVPLLIGQTLKLCLNIHQSHHLNSISQGALLFVIYTTFCDTFYSAETSLSAFDVIITVTLVLLLQIILLILSFKLTQCFKKYYNPQDVIALIFCSTHKSLTLGIPILKIMFHGYSHLGQISLPLIVYHPMQIILGGLIVAQLKDWVYSQRAKKLPL